MQESGAGSASPGKKIAPHVLDVRGMQAPENIIAILKRVGELSKNSVLEIRAESNPFQLYDLLQQRGFFLEMHRQKDGSYEGTIRSRDIEEPEH